MTNTGIIQTIKAEIERLKNYAEESKKEWVKEGYNQNAFAEDCRISSFDKLLSFLSTLETEKPVPNDLEEAAVEYKKQVIEETKCHHNALTYAEGYEDALLLIPDAFIAGGKWDREQIMENAVDGEITKDNRGNNVVRSGVFNNDFEIGDKVRVIVIKE